MRLAYILTALLPFAVAGELQIDVTNEVGCSRKAQAGDVVSVHYEGSLEDGSVFDASYTRGQPISFKLGVGQVIQGWDQGIVGMCPGDKRTLTIPPDLGYGSRGAGGIIPPNATLKFKTELVDIAGVVAEKDEL